MLKNECSNEMVIVLTTESDPMKADCLAKALLQRKLAACVSIREVNSNYWWQDNIESQVEFELLIKTTFEKLTNLIKALENLHSYEIPEVIYWPVSAGNAYCKWAESVIEEKCN